MSRSPEHPREELLRRAVRLAVFSWLARVGPPLEPEEGSRWELPDGRRMVYRSGVWRHEDLQDTVVDDGGTSCASPGRVAAAIARIGRAGRRLLGKFSRGTPTSCGGRDTAIAGNAASRNRGLTDSPGDSAVLSQGGGDRPSGSEKAQPRSGGVPLVSGSAATRTKGGRSPEEPEP